MAAEVLWARTAERTRLSTLRSMSRKEPVESSALVVLVLVVFPEQVGMGE